MNKVFTDPKHFLAFGFGAGLSPKAPGTVGTLVAVIIFVGLSFLPVLAYLIVVSVSFVLGVWVCDRVARDLADDDPSGVVFDEFVGFWLAMTLVPPSWYWILMGFLLFRFFDIIKPWPISWFDRNIKGGLGIMVDDVVAGAVTWIILQTAIYAYQQL